MTLLHSHRHDSALAPSERRKVTIPVESDVFQQHPKATFFIGVIAVPGMVIDPGLYDAAARLRYEVYVREKGLMRAPLLSRLTRRERDRDDKRSVHFVVVQNGGKEGRHQLVGASRHIVKDKEGNPLPIERHYPEAFTEGGVAVNGVEASRFIARNGSKQSQHRIARGLIRAMAMWMDLDYRQPVYAVVDDQLAGMFRFDKVPFTELAEPKVLSEYSTDRYQLPNTPIAINSTELVRTMTGPESTEESRAFYADVFVHRGLGYFDSDMHALGQHAPETI